MEALTLGHSQAQYTSCDLMRAQAIRSSTGTRLAHEALRASHNAKTKEISRLKATVAAQAAQLVQVKATLDIAGRAHAAQLAECEGINTAQAQAIAHLTASNEDQSAELTILNILLGLDDAASIYHRQQAQYFDSYPCAVPRSAT